MNSHMPCQITFSREFLGADMTLVHDGFLIVLAPGINNIQTGQPILNIKNVYNVHRKNTLRT